MENESIIGITDPEFDTSSQQKIDFAHILMQQINYVRFLRSQDMGEFALFDLNGYSSDVQKEAIWFQNLSKYINSVNSFKSLLITYQDDEFKKKIKSLNDDFKKNFTKRRDKITKTKDYEQKLKALNMIFNLKNKVKLYSKIFEECLLLAKKAHFIGGDDTITDFA